MLPQWWILEGWRKHWVMSIAHSRCCGHDDGRVSSAVFLNEGLHMRGLYWDLENNMKRMLTSKTIMALEPLCVVCARQNWMRRWFLGTHPLHDLDRIFRVCLLGSRTHRCGAGREKRRWEVLDRWEDVHWVCLFFFFITLWFWCFAADLGVRCICERSEVKMCNWDQLPGCRGELGRKATRWQWSREGMATWNGSGHQVEGRANRTERWRWLRWFSRWGQSH